MSNKKTNNKKHLTKLGETDNETGYIKPELTNTDAMTNDDIKKVLEDYKKVEADQLIKSDHVRYFVINKDKTTSFRLGGWVLKTDGMPDYIVLTNGKLNWSVQCANTIFYKQNSQTEIIEQLKLTIAKKNDMIEECNYENNILQKQLDEKTKENVILLKHNKTMIKEIAKKDKQIVKLEETVKKLQKK